MTDPREPIREALDDIENVLIRLREPSVAQRAAEARGTLALLRVVQPGEVVLSAEQAWHLGEYGLLAHGKPGGCPTCVEIRALLASGPDREQV